MKDRIAFILRYFADRTHGHTLEHYRSRQLEATTTFDDGLDFIVAFDEAFPGRVRDPNHKNAEARLYRVLRQMTHDGLLHRGRLGNEVDLPGTPKWQFMYWVPDQLITDLKRELYSCEDAAERWAVSRDLRG